MKCSVRNIEGKEVKNLELQESIFASEQNDAILHSVVKAYRSNRRQGTHATKTRSLVSGGGKKPFKQKGTGNARQGSSRSLLMEGGGVAHGPQPRDYTKLTNKKLRQKAVKVALSEKVKSNNLVVVDDFAASEYKTRHVVQFLGALGLKDKKRVLLSDGYNKKLQKSSSNIHGVDVKTPETLNAEDILRCEVLVCSEKALSVLTERFQEGV